MTTGTKISIGCGLLVLIILIIGLVGGVYLKKMYTNITGGNLQQFDEQMKKDPTYGMAKIAAKLGGGDIVAEDHVNKRYTLKDKNGKFTTTIYWDETTKTTKTINGDFSAVPTTPGITPTPDSH